MTVVDTNEVSTEQTEVVSAETCGIIMPISDTEGYRPKHWEEVTEILYEVINDAGFKPKIVSDSKIGNIIHNEIVKNIAENPILICDVSSKNPNVMFELGLRLAFDKATIVIKDNDTNYNFDTSPIRHLEYPKDLRHSEILVFKAKLKEMLTATYEAYNNGTYTTFLQSFTTYKPKLQEEEVGFKEYFDRKLDSVLNEVRLNKTFSQNPTVSNITYSELLGRIRREIDIYISTPTGEKFHDKPLDSRVNVIYQFIKLRDQATIDSVTTDELKLLIKNIIVQMSLNQ